MDRFNSLFELFAAFNFAFVLSSNFTEDLTGLVIKNGHAIKKVYLKLSGKLEEISGAITGRKLKKRLKKLKDCCSPLMESILKISERHQTSEYFNYYSFSVGVYSLIVLFYSGLGLLNVFKNPIHLVNFEAYNIIFTLCLIVLFYRRKGDKEYWIIKTNLFSVIGSIIIGLILMFGICIYTSDKSFDFMMINVTNDPEVVILEVKLWIVVLASLHSMLIPVVHFFYQFIRLMNDRHKIDDLDFSKLNSHLIECENIHEQMLLHRQKKFDKFFTKFKKQ